MPLNIICDVFVWGNHWGSINAAVEAARQGWRVYLLSPDEHIGHPGVIGLGATDIGRYGSRNLGNWTNREFYDFMTRYVGGGPASLARTCPSVAEMGYKFLLDKYGVQVIANVVLESCAKTPVSITTTLTSPAQRATAFGAMPEAMDRITSVNFHSFSSAYDIVNPVPRGVWTAITNYLANDEVTHVGGDAVMHTYVARIDNVGMAPDVSPDDWFVSEKPATRTITARHYIDSDEDGDFAWMAGCAANIGREDDAVTLEGLAGFRPKEDTFVPFDCFVSPTAPGVPGELINGFWKWPTDDNTPTGVPLVEGNLDPWTDQIYGFRSPCTSNPPNLRRWPRPKGLFLQTDLVTYPFGYDTSQFEIYIRGQNGGAAGSHPANPETIPPTPATGMYASQNFKPVASTGRTMQDKTDINNDSGIYQVAFHMQDATTRAGRTARMQMRIKHETERYGWLYHCYANGSLGTQAYMSTFAMSLDEFQVPSSPAGNTRGLPFSFYRRGYKRLKNPRYMTTRMDTQSATIPPIHDPGGETVKLDGVSGDYYSLDNHVNRRIGANPDGTPLMRMHGGVLKAGYILDGQSIGIDGHDRQVTPGWHRSYYTAFPREISNLAVPNNCGMTSVAMSSGRIDAWKANYAGVMGYAAALALKYEAQLGTPVEMFQLDPVEINTGVPTTGPGAGMVGTIALGNVVTPNVPDFTTFTTFMATGGDMEEEKLIDTFEDPNVLADYGGSYYASRS